MRVISKTQEHEIASVFVAENGDGKLIEFVESTQPPMVISKKWVIIVSTLFGCPVDCKFCDAGGDYKGKLSAADIFFQIDYLVNHRFPSGVPETDKFKVQFARMGEPSFNPAVLEVLEQFPGKYPIDNFVASLSSIAPHGTDNFFEELLRIKKGLYDQSFQLQFSVHSTDVEQRNMLMPVTKWSFGKMAAYGERFYSEGGKKITLNFALGKDNILDPHTLKQYFDPDIFLVKLTPVNPTFKARLNNIDSLIVRGEKEYPVVDGLKAVGYEVILSIGEWEENKIGSNCGQYIKALDESCHVPEGSYSYKLKDV
ncbi:MAG: radical SAM protein [Bacteroidetes bacterium]|nr:MAG: radical SAM protein [Bacteroidota bacterium]